eukprot:933831_1
MKCLTKSLLFLAVLIVTLQNGVSLGSKNKRVPFKKRAQLTREHGHLTAKSNEQELLDSFEDHGLNPKAKTDFFDWIRKVFNGPKCSSPTSHIKILHENVWKTENCADDKMISGAICYMKCKDCITTKEYATCASKGTMYLHFGYKTKYELTYHPFKDNGEHACKDHGRMNASRPCDDSN